MLLFQKAFTGWYIGQRKESEELWYELGKLKNISPEHMDIIQDNINRLKKDNNIN
jgi:hypothetical protein